jgi:glyoxylase-like metal-dependent hydrolase (beta-lactamase superfamily II)
VTRADLPVAATWFDRETMEGGVTRLSEPHVDAFARCNIWHIRGRTRDLLIDTGLGVSSLRSAARDLFERPITAVITHGHYDHTGGAYEFEDRRSHVGDSAELARPSGFRGLTAEDLGADVVRVLRGAGYVLPDVLLTAIPHAGFAVERYAVRPAPPTQLLVDGDIVDLGDRAFEVMHLPGHSPGSIGLWDANRGVLFSGDAVYDGPLLYDLPGASIAAYRRTLERLLSLPVAVVHAGHDASFGGERLRAIASSYLARWDAELV